MTFEGEILGLTFPRKSPWWVYIMSNGSMKVFDVVRCWRTDFAFVEQHVSELPGGEQVRVSYFGTGLVPT